MIRWFQSVLMACLLASGTELSLFADAAANPPDALTELRRQNELLREQLQKQNDAIESLSRKVSSLEEKSSGPIANDPSGPPAGFGSAQSGKLHFSGEGAVGFFDSGPAGAFPNSEFRMDEARLFVDAAIWNDVYGFLELNMATRETSDLYLNLGEAYLEFENISKLWNREGLLNLRAGRMDIPFGEEYLYRDAINNPLISHSVADFWGIDEGVEIYGAIARVNYVLAVQNGSTATTRDFTSDKSVTARVGFDPARHVHVGLSAMRTGNLNVNAGEWSEMWIGNGLFSSIGSAATTEFHANLAQGDLRVSLPHGHLHFAGGFARYDDNDPAGDNKRDFWFWSAEGVQSLTQKLYMGVRFSQIWVNGGYPLAGQGNFGPSYFGSPTDRLWRLSLGLGYRFSENLVVKTEYSVERGNTLSGSSRDQEDMFSVQAAFKF